MNGESNAHNVNHGDIVILGTDGLFDNIHRSVILDMIKPYVKWTDG